ncbi:MAG: hypothetical protein PVJ53_02015 [Desulfobacterales bacterium]|jgi:hypothetical protein
MDQLNLFHGDQKTVDADAAPSLAIRSGRVGPIRFGATRESYAMISSVLADLARPSIDAGQDLS